MNCVDENNFRDNDFKEISFNSELYHPVQDFAISTSGVDIPDDTPLTRRGPAIILLRVGPPFL